MKKVILIIVILTFQYVNTIAVDKTDIIFFDQVDAFYKKYVKNGLVAYNQLNNSLELRSLVKTIEMTDLSDADAAIRKAFYINAYNIIVINAVVEYFPIKSVMEVNGFFDVEKHLIAGEMMTLSDLEKNKLLKVYKDARFHFVLVCGAIGCPPITDFAYRPEKLDVQLEIQTKKALNNPEFLKILIAKNTVELSEIFKWYIQDFGGTKKAVIQFINKYRTSKIPDEYTVGYYTYDWNLNLLKTDNVRTELNTGTNKSRYVVSAAIPKGAHEIKLFNNLYSQIIKSSGNEERSTFFTSTLSYLYGLTNKFNLGIETRYRRVRNDTLPSTNFDVFGNSGAASTRQGFTFLGPKIRWAPIKKLSHFSLQSTLLFPLGKDQEGSNSQPYIDWNNVSWITQFFYDQDVGRSFSLFTEIDLYIDDIGKNEKGASNRFSTPATVIFSYFPMPTTTIYVLGSYSPYYTTPFDYYYQYGVGAKYQFTSKLELEILYTFFYNKFLLSENGKANTVNFGLRRSF
ncbi:DUF547 domain-containing protein [Bacteroidota bacterium]